MGIVERLRAGVPCCDPDAGNGEGSYFIEDADETMHEAADLIERLKGYAVHDEECDINQPFKGVEFPPCTCGLSALIKEANDD